MRTFISSAQKWRNSVLIFAQFRANWGPARKCAKIWPRENFYEYGKCKINPNASLRDPSARSWSDFFQDSGQGAFLPPPPRPTKIKSLISSERRSIILLLSKTSLFGAQEYCLPWIGKLVDPDRKLFELYWISVDYGGFLCCKFYFCLTVSDKLSAKKLFNPFIHYSFIQVWYSEDLKNNDAHDNGGKVCLTAQVLYADPEL